MSARLNSVQRSKKPGNGWTVQKDVNITAIRIKYFQAC